ncbi:eIF-3 zeta [Dictyostelium purpureum]|uniref:Eukaryotic translation initiation factor 3 subunit D n=1 Tax=Dictyostelium purpureum TaxID=5786 RepID=F0Z618_DICPU|nr:eIF-3 zeta [Dictyostelium purpureum]EGC40576.1 eIF-3 zeta [Dictyostelium purpureum]|eukprot:XP_003282912.1 eIF-3 zeta [Dictyostelium purpureum]
MSLELPNVKSNPSGWGPITKLEKFTDIPYAPFSKGDKIGKCSDWNSNVRNYQRQNYGSNVFNPFTFKLEDDEDSFKLVDYTRVSAKLKNKGKTYQKQFYQQSKRGGSSNRGAARGRGGRYANKYWNDRRQRNRESSIEIGSSWESKEEFDLQTFKQYTLENLPESETIGTYGKVKYYNRVYDRINTKNEKKLQKSEVNVPLIPTSDDKVIRSEYMNGNVYATDSILAILMSAQKSVFSWDIVVQKVGARLFFELRPGTSEQLTVNENVSSHQDEKDPINTSASLSSEATQINLNYWQQVLSSDAEPVALDNELPEGEEFENTVDVGYAYKKWDLGDDIVVLARTEIDAAIEDASGEPKFISIKAINEHDSNRFGIEFRKKLDTQRAAILATEIKNNSTKFAKWSIQSTLAGCEMMNLGFVSRDSVRDNNNHVILGTQFYPVADLNKQNGVDMKNCWGIIKHIAQTCMKLANGKYLLHRDPNRNVITLYSVPENAFDQIEEETEEEEEEEQSKGWVDESRE